MTTSPHLPSEDASLTPAESARLIKEQTRIASETLATSGAPLYFAWGGVWLIAYLVMGLSYSEYWPAALPPWIGGVVMATLLVAAMAYTAWYIARHARGVRGRSARVGAWYGWSWFLGFTFMGVLGGSLSNAGISQGAVNLYFTVSPALLVGLGYISGGLLFDDRDESIIGLVVLIVGILAAAAGPDWAWLIMSLAGGGTLLLGGLIVAVIDRRLRSAP